MTRRALPLLSLGLLLGSCSLINAYDDVGGEGGGASTSSSTGTGPGSGGAGGGASTSSASGGGGSGGGGAPSLSCVRDGDVVTVHVPPGGTTSKIDAVRVFPLNGQTDRLAVVRSTGLQMYEVNDAGNVVTGATTAAVRFLDIRPSGPGISALAVTDSGGQARLSVFRWLDGDPIADPAIAGPLAELSNDDQRAVFRHRGPSADDVDVLLMSQDPDSQEYDVSFRRFGIPVPIQLQLVDDADSREAAEPRAFIQAGTTIHAFVGSPVANLGETVRYSFEESATTVGPPSSLGGDGTFLSDLAPSGTGQFNVVIGEFVDTTLLLRHGKLPNADLGTFKQDEVPAVREFAALDEVPFSNPPYLINDVMFSAGITEVSGGVGARWSMVLGKVGAASELNGIRLDEPDFLELQDDAHTGFGPSAHVGTREAVSAVGGRMSVAWTERTVGGSDALYLARFQCTND